MSNYQIQGLQRGDHIPFDLLLLADESMEAIEKYIHDSEVYVVHQNGHQEPVAAFALYRISDAELEIKNIAVAEILQGKGMGSYLIAEIKQIAAAKGYTSLIVGTPDTGVREISFYERNGFVKYDIKKNFFVDNYPEPIVNDGIVLKDMVMLKMKI